MTKSIQVLAFFTLALASGLFSQNLNVDYRAKMVFASQSVANVWGYTAPDGREYALVGASQGLVIADVTNPDAPVQVVQIPGPNNLWKEIKTYGHFAYVTSEGGQGLQIVDLSGLPSPNLAYKFYKGDGAIAGQLNRIHALHVDETKGFVYLYGSGLFSGAPVVLDLKPDPYNPTYAGNFTALGYVHDGYVDNDTMFSGHIYAGQFAIVDMRNKANPQLLGQQTTPNQFTHNTWLSQDRRTLLATDETANSYLSAWDVSDPENIIALDKIQSNPGSNSAVHNTHIRGDFAVTSWYKDGFTIVDISRPDNLVQTGNFDNYPGSGSGYEGCWGVYPFFPSGTVIASVIRAQGTSNGELWVLTPTYVRACHLEGRITNGITGAPILNAKVEILGAVPANSEFSNLAGIYKMGQAASGTVTVRVSKSGFQTAERQVLLQNGSLALLDVELFPPGNLQVGGEVRGGKRQLLIPGASVFLFGPELTLETKTNANGQFDFADIAPGRYDLAATDTLHGMTMLYRQLLLTDTSYSLMLARDHRRDAKRLGEAADWQIFPNPFQSESMVYVKKALASGQGFELFDAAGRLVESFGCPGENGSFSFGENLPAGIYLLRGGGVVVRVLKTK